MPADGLSGRPNLPGYILFLPFTLVRIQPGAREYLLHARILEQAVIDCVREKRCTRDLGGPLGTRATGDVVRDRAREIAGRQG